MKMAMREAQLHLQLADQPSQGTERGSNFPKATQPDLAFDTLFSHSVLRLTSLYLSSL